MFVLHITQSTFAGVYILIFPFFMKNRHIEYEILTEGLYQTNAYIMTDGIFVFAGQHRPDGRPW